MLSIFKRDLQEPYRVVVDDGVDIVDLDSMNFYDLPFKAVGTKLSIT